MFFQQFNRFMMAAAFTAALAAAQSGTSTTTTTNTSTTGTSNTPPVGLASSETAQINLVNIASPLLSCIGTCVGVPAVASCTGTVTFLNSNGTVIGSATPFTVASGVIQSVSLPFSNSGATGTRTEIRATISRTITQSPGVVPCNLQVTLETYDTNTGVTHVFLANVAGNVAFPETFVGSIPNLPVNR